MSDEMSRAEIREIAREVAKEVIEEMGKSGVHLTPEEKMYVRRAAEGANQVATWTRRAAVMTAVTGLIWLVVEGVKKALGG